MFPLCGVSVAKPCVNLGDDGLRRIAVGDQTNQMQKSFGEVLAKQWPKDIRERFDVEQDPFMLVIDKDFADFDPNEHRWIIPLTHVLIVRYWRS